MGGYGGRTLMRLDASTIDEYLAAADEREADLRAIDALVVDTAPDLERQLFAGPSITMIGYGAMSWERPSGSGVWPLIGLALQKQYISMYVAAVKDGQTLASAYADRLGKTANGKNCIRFRRIADIDTDELANAVRDAVAWSAVQEERFGRNCAAPVE
jgi:Domain of unknown function (DU1801)